MILINVMLLGIGSYLFGFVYGALCMQEFKKKNT